MTASEAMADDAFALNADGSAKSPAAFRSALKQDAEKLAALQNEPEVAKGILGEADQEFQELLKSGYRVCLALDDYCPAG